MGQALQRHLPHHRDRRGVQEVGDLGAREGGAHDHAPPSSTTSRVVPARPCRRSCRRRSRMSPTSTARASIPASCALCSVCPTAATCGSVKITRGDSGAVGGDLRVLAEDHVGGHARLVLAHVGEQRAAVHVADRVQPVAARGAHRSSTSIVLPGSSPTARARGRRCGAAADRHEQLVGHDRRAALSSTVISPPERLTASPSGRGGRPRPARAATRPPARSRTAPRARCRRSAASISVTCEPSVRQACAISTPTTPPPRIASRAGHRLGRRDLAVGPRLGLAQAVDRRDRARRAGGHDHRLLGHQRVVARPAPGARRRGGRARGPARSRGSPATAAARSRRGRGSPRRGGRAPPATSSSPVTASRAPGTRRTSASSSPGRSRAFEGMQA